MKRIKSFSSVSRTLLAVVLFSLTISFAFSSSKYIEEGSRRSISRREQQPARSDNQLAYEERESEKDDEIQNNFSLVYISTDSVSLFILVEQNGSYDKVLTSANVFSSIPLYLSKRVLLI